MTITFLWIQFVVLALVIMTSGSRLVRDAEIIADKTKLGGTLVGILLLAAITSLPELFNGAGSVLFAKEPDLTVGDIVGSLLINLVIFACVTFFLKKGEWEKLGTPALLLSGFLSCVMTSLFVLVHWLSVRFPVPQVGWIGWYSFLLLLVYCFFVWVLFRYEKSHQALVGETVPEAAHVLTLNQAVRGFVINSLMIVAAGTYIPVVAHKISALSGIASSFMGFIFLAVATSLPELVVVGQAVRLGLIHMALGDVFGSNLFDVAILPLDDFLYFKGDLLSDSSFPLAIGAVASILMTAIFLIALKMKLPGKTLGRIRVSALLVIAIYVVSVVLIYKAS